MPFLSPGDLPNPEMDPMAPALQANSLPTELQGKPYVVGGVPSWKLNNCNTDPLHAQHTPSLLHIILVELGEQRKPLDI